MTPIFTQLRAEYDARARHLARLDLRARVAVKVGHDPRFAGVGVLMAVSANV